MSSARMRMMLGRGLAATEERNVSANMPATIAKSGAVLMSSVKCNLWCRLLNTSQPVRLRHNATILHAGRDRPRRRSRCGRGTDGGGLSSGGFRFFSVRPLARLDQARVDLLVSDHWRLGSRVERGDRGLEEVGVVAVGELGFVMRAARFIPQ